jgi:hypothetical protein
MGGRLTGFESKTKRRKRVLRERETVERASLPPSPSDSTELAECPTANRDTGSNLLLLDEIYFILLSVRNQTKPPRLPQHVALNRVNASGRIGQTGN